MTDALDDLTAKGQALLKSEWDKVKREAQRGALADSPTLWQMMVQKCCWLYHLVETLPRRPR